MTYYLVAPVLVSLWPLLVSMMYLPDARRSMKQEQTLCVEGQKHILDILRYDPERLRFAPEKDETEFSFDKAIARAANMCGIRSAHGYSVGGIGGDKNDKKTQNAKVDLKAVGIVQAATFLSSIQSMWVGLKCDQVKLTKKKGMPDQWDAEMKFWYTY